MEKVVYLFGAGATHAEVMNMYPDPGADELVKNGLLINHVSRRVMAKASNDDSFTNGIESIISKDRSGNIEQLVSLIESNEALVKDSHKKADKLRSLVAKDIKKYLKTKGMSNEPMLYKGLLELHHIGKIQKKEDVLGFITLNYDQLLDDAYNAIFCKEPNYCMTSISDNGLPVLKLHGSFNMPKLKMGQNEIDVPIIPLGIRKNYLELPFNFIWGKAGEILAECNKLRVIGCSLDQNDWGLIDLLFKSHLWRGEPYQIEIIDFDSIGEKIRNTLGFLPKITKAYSIEINLIKGDMDSPEVHPLANPFKIWLNAKTRSMLMADEIVQTNYLKHVCGLTNT